MMKFHSKPQLVAETTIGTYRAGPSELCDAHLSLGSHSKQSGLCEGDTAKNDSDLQDGFTISWHNLNYHVGESKWYDKLLKSTTSRQGEQILSNLSGSFASGELSAVLGPSGAGKSTLIKCLLSRKTCGISGRTQVSFNKTHAVEQEIRDGRRSFDTVIIPQKTHLLNGLTVFETLMFASRLKNAHLIYADQSYDALDRDNETPIKQLARKPFDHYANVQRVMRQINLESCATVRCGKLSGGQYKRVAIGVELLSRPQLMILDEPTSGLDSVSSFHTVKTLRQLAGSLDYPLAIVAIVHQPDIELINLFHKAYILAAGGRAIYEGPIDGIFSAVQRGLELVANNRRTIEPPNLEFPQDTSGKLGELRSRLNATANVKNGRLNPARLAIEIASGEFGGELVDVMATHQIDQSDQRKSVVSLTAGVSNGGTSKVRIDLEPVLVDEKPCAAQLDKILAYSGRTRATAGCDHNSPLQVYLEHVRLHTKRSWLTIIRDPIFTTLQFVLHIIVPLFISYSFVKNQGRDACPIAGPLDVVEEAYRPDDAIHELRNEVRGVFENVSYMFLQTYVITYSAVCATSLIYPLALQVLLREYRNGWYSLSSYLLGRTVADLPVPTFNVAIAIAISYYCTNQPSSPYEWRFVGVTILTIITILVAQTHGLIVGAMLMNRAHSAVYFAPVSTTPFFIICGFLLRTKLLPAPLRFLSKISYPTHLMNGFVILRYGFNKCPCDGEQFEINPEHMIPAKQRKVMDPWVASFKSEYPNHANTTPDLIGKLVDIVTKGKTFSQNIENCAQVKPYAMYDYQLSDEDLATCFMALLIIYFIFRMLAYTLLVWKINGHL